MDALQALETNSRYGVVEIKWDSIPVVDGPTHFWMNPDFDTTLDPDDQILCVKMGSRPRLDIGEEGNITYNISKVTCQSCLEWLHA